MTAAELLDEWQRWSWHYLPDIGYSLNPINALMKDDETAGWGDDAPAPEPAEIPVDAERAYATDRLICTLAVAHVLTIKRHYINRRCVTWEDLGAAQRALQDKINAGWIV